MVSVSDVEGCGVLFGGRHQWKHVGEGRHQSSWGIGGQQPPELVWLADSSQGALVDGSST